MSKLNPLLPSSIEAFSQAEISYHIGKSKGVGRSFTVSFKDPLGKSVKTDVRFKELVDQFFKLSKITNDKLLIKSVYSKLKSVNFYANRAILKQSSWYQFLTKIHRLSNIFRKDHQILLDRALTQKNMTIPKSPIWYDDVIFNLPNYRSLNGFSRRLQVNKANGIAKSYKKLASKHKELTLMAGNYSLNKRMISFTPQGLSIIASYLKEKHQLKNLFVCDTLEAMQSKLKEIAENPEDTRASLVFSIRGIGVDSGLTPNNQHKVTIGIEKKDGKIKIIYLDGEPKNFQKNLLAKQAKDLIDLEWSFDRTCVFWSIFHSGINMNNVELYQSTVKREYGSYGCETIALRDAVDFLQTPNFFESVPLYNKDSVVSDVDSLPPQFMKSTQSRTALKKYIKDHPNEALKKSMKRNNAKGYDAKGILRNQNHYVSFRSYKYHAMLLEAMNSLTTAELKAIIDQTYVKVDHPPMVNNIPITLYDLYNNYWN